MISTAEPRRDSIVEFTSSVTGTGRARHERESITDITLMIPKRARGLFFPFFLHCFLSYFLIHSSPHTLFILSLSLGVYHFISFKGGSITGRLRAASDLADFGLIDPSQKGLIKELIVSGFILTFSPFSLVFSLSSSHSLVGDPALKYALDKYEKGDFRFDIN